MQETEQGGFTGGLLLVIFSDLHLYTTKKRHDADETFFLLFPLSKFFFVLFKFCTKTFQLIG